MDEVYTIRDIYDNVAQGDELSHLDWIKNWSEPFPIPPIMRNDMKRCEAVKSYNILDDDEDILQSLVETINDIFGFPITAISIVSDNTVYYKASVGLPYEQIDRSRSICNYTIKKGSPFIVPSITDHETFSKYDTVIQFYAGVPIINSTGYVIGTLFVADYGPCHDFSIRDVCDLEKYAESVMKQIQIKKIIKNKRRIKSERFLLETQLHKSLVPSNKITFVFTDIENSTALWNEIPKQMKHAQQLHDICMRQTIYDTKGYEVCTEGDAFQIAFHNSFNAIQFTLLVQKRLLSLKWPEQLLCHKSANIVYKDDIDEKKLLFRGLRVRMGVHTGEDFYSKMDNQTLRTKYYGKTVSVTQAISETAHGGQIVLSVSTWNEISFQLSDLLNPIAIDLGKHIINSNLDPIQLYQLTSKSLSCSYYTEYRDIPVVSRRHKRGPSLDFYENISKTINSSTQIKGRLFGPLRSLHKLTLSFNDAPREIIVMAFLLIKNQMELSLKNPIKMEQTIENLNIKVRQILSNDGYECQESNGNFMIAFENTSDALKWGFTVLKVIEQKDLQISIGMSRGTCVEYRPHVQTGKMDYFGSLINKTARIAYLDHDYKKVLIDQSVKNDIVSNNVVIKCHDVTKLKGIKESVQIYSIREKDSLDKISEYVPGQIV